MDIHMENIRVFQNILPMELYKCACSLAREFFNIHGYILMSAINKKNLIVYSITVTNWMRIGAISYFISH